MENMEIVKPKLDVVFKRLFTKNDNILKAFLSAVMEMPKEEITEIVVKSPETLPDTEDGKLSRLDVNLIVNNMKVNVEIQLCNEGSFPERSLYYWSKLYSGDLKKGEGYSDLKKTVCINILNFNLFDCDEPYSKFQLLEENRYELLTDKCAIYFFELLKLDDEIDKDDMRKLWLQFVNAETNEELDMLNKTEIPELREAIGMLKTLSADEKMRQEAWLREKTIRDYISGMSNAENRGIEKGIAIGEERGMQKGRQEGIGIGRQKERNQMIDKMRLKGYTEEQIRELFS